MALKANFDFQNQIYTGVYIRIIRATTMVSDKEFFEAVDDDKISEQLTWTKYWESYAVMYVYLDEDCRKRNVHPLHVQQFRFDYDINSSDNIFKQAYEQLAKTTDLFTDIVSV